MTTSKQLVQAALKDLKSKKYSSIARAAEAYSIPLSTLGLRVSGGQSQSQAQECNRRLTSTEEQELVQWVIELTSHNIPARVCMLNGMATIILQSQSLPPLDCIVGP